MTSQPRSRRSGPLAGDAGSRARTTVIKASGDSVPCNVHSKQSTQRSRSKHKLPRSVRYELDNALVGLCDVWFEEIKPHLVRNNIKVHIEEAGTGTASGDHPYLSPGITGCSHLHPGAASDSLRPQYANYVGCCSTPQTASRARCPRPPVRVPPSQSPPLPPTPPPALPVLHLRRTNYKTLEYDKVSQRPGLRLIHSPPTQPNNWRLPSSCRTYSTIPQILIPRTRIRNIRTAPHSLLNRNRTPPHAPSQPQTPVMVDKWTQTPHRYQSHLSRRLTTEGSDNHGTTATSPQQYLPRGLSPKFRRCPGTTTFFRPKLKRSHKDKSLFDENLIDAIVTNYINDKGLKVLYESATQEYPSSMNLVALLKTRRRDGGTRKMPWR